MNFYAMKHINKVNRWGDSLVLDIYIYNQQGISMRNLGETFEKQLMG